MPQNNHIKTLKEIRDQWRADFSEWIEFPDNKPSLLSQIIGSLTRKIKYFITVIRAPFLTATIAPILLGSSIAYWEFNEFNWNIFWS